MEFNTLEKTSTEDILHVFNLSFSDYFIPFELTEDQLRSKMTADKTDLKLSVGVFEGNKLIAFILHGVDVINNRKTTYNGGTGVIPDKRGTGLTKKMYQFIMPILKKNGVETLTLEVIDNNIQAIKSYKKSGYSAYRELICYKGKVKKTKNLTNVNIKLLPEYDWNIMESFWDITPSWQNSKNVVTELFGKNISIGAYIDDELVGYLIFSPNSQRIQQIVVSNQYRRQGIASALIHNICQQYGDSISIINVDENSTSTNVFLQKIGLSESLRQLEMKLMTS